MKSWLPVHSTDCSALAGVGGFHWVILVHSSHENVYGHVCLLMTIDFTMGQYNTKQMKSFDIESSLKQWVWSRIFEEPICYV